MEGKRVIVRTENAGVFFGLLKRYRKREVTLENARRIWYWRGAATLSQLAMAGTSRPEECKFPMPVNRILINQVIEIIETTPEAQKSIDEVPIWEG